MFFCFCLRAPVVQYGEYLGQGPGAAAPCVDHHSILLPLLQQLVLKQTVMKDWLDGGNFH